LVGCQHGLFLRNPLFEWTQRIKSLKIGARAFSLERAKGAFVDGYFQGLPACLVAGCFARVLPGGGGLGTATAEAVRGCAAGAPCFARVRERALRQLPQRR